MTDNSEPEFTFHDTAAINRYCETDYRPPKRPWLGVHDGKKQEQANLGVTVLKIVKVAFPTGAFRWASLRSRYRYAAWHWIAPSMEFTPDKLDLLKNISGLGSVDTAEFVSQLSFYCRRAAN